MIDIHQTYDVQSLKKNHSMNKGRWVKGNYSNLYKFMKFKTRYWCVIQYFLIDLWIHRTLFLDLQIEENNIRNLKGNLLNRHRNEPFFIFAGIAAAHQNLGDQIESLRDQASV